MKFRILMSILLFAPAILYAYGRPGCGNKDKDKDKDKVHCKGKRDAANMEAFVFVLPTAPEGKSCQAKNDFRMAVVNFYKWYLQNKDKITTGLSQEDKGKDLIPPFNISWQTLHEYFEVIREKYADWVSDISTDPAAYASPAAVQAAPSKGANKNSSDASGNSSTFSNLAQ